jgi:O-methyltransferase
MANLYLELLKQCVLGITVGETELIPVVRKNPFKKAIISAFARRGYQIVSPQIINRQDREHGWINSHIRHGETMIGRARLHNIQYCIEQILKDQIPGDLIETGVWRGGACIFMRGVLKAYGVKNRTVWVADSFEGLPQPNPRKYPCDAGDTYYTRKELAISLDEVKANFAKYDLLDEQVKFLKGWFRDTLPVAPIKHLAVARLDGDMYESTMDALSLYPKLSVGGFLIVDDYGAIPSCKAAVQDYRQQFNITEKIIQIDREAVYWQKE